MVNTKKPNFDGIKSSKPKQFFRSAAITVRPRRVAMDEIRRAVKTRPLPSIPLAPVFSVPPRPRPHPGRFKFGPQLKSFALVNRSSIVAACGIILAFGLGMWYAVGTPKSVAEDPLLIVPAATAPASDPIPLVSAPAGTDQNLNNDLLFNTPLQLLKDYLAQAAPPDQVEIRKAKLHQFLTDRNSPLEPEADLIAEQDHWKLILAISFAESTLGKKCFDFNCSGIGGSQIRSYKSYNNWILDFNRLLDNRYKDKTLEQMCGVYVQPCNPHWLVATKQILTALDDQGIE